MAKLEGITTPLLQPDRAARGQKVLHDRIEMEVYRKLGSAGFIGPLLPELTSPSWISGANAVGAESPVQEPPSRAHDGEYGFGWVRESKHEDEPLRVNPQVDRIHAEQQDLEAIARAMRKVLGEDAPVPRPDGVAPELGAAVMPQVAGLVEGTELVPLPVAA